MFKKVAPKPENIHLGEGILIKNFDPRDLEKPESTRLGVTRGGGTWNLEFTNRSSRFDGDRGEDTKGLKSRIESKITITANMLELDYESMQIYTPSKLTESTSNMPPTPAFKMVRPKVDFEEEDYFDNLAYVTRTKSGKLVAYVIENVLADGSLSAAMNDKDDIVPEITFTAHWEDLDVVPAYVVYYE
ncbi:hypothetical protein [Sutcliffiella cohnii]|uniref:hypothetical protein n=1 Tax=Sutcliffiella cohnii TaxID=33932 RepID=UPI002E1C94F9|nr:hypothetical protein [Sutcliffiella cohnii]